MDLWWQTDENSGDRLLYCGCNDAHLAWLEKRNKYWSAVIWLPGLEPSKKYAPLEEQLSDVTKKVERWFALANTFRPVTDEVSGE